MTKKEFFRKEWDASYERGENNILYPQTEVVKFINRFVAKKIDNHNIREIMKSPISAPLQCLDFACGAGVHSILCEEFGVLATGIDISKSAISQAKNNAKQKGFEALSERFFIIKQDKASLDFADNAFDFTIAESCLDSMYFEHAQNYFNELVRVTKNKIYFSVIGVDKNALKKASDTLVKTSHEYNTIQSYYDYDQILKLVGGHKECLEYCMELIEHKIIPENIINKRFHVVVNVNKVTNRG